MIYQCQDDIKQLLNRRVLPLMKQRTQAALAGSGRAEAFPPPIAAQ